jgi:ribosome maturation factor RimP
MGERVQIKARLPLNGRRRFIGKLQNVGEAVIEIDVDGEMVSIAFSDIDKARLVPNI